MPMFSALNMDVRSTGLAASLHYLRIFRVSRIMQAREEAISEKP